MGVAFGDLMRRAQKGNWNQEHILVKKTVILEPSLIKVKPIAPYGVVKTDPKTSQDLHIFIFSCQSF